MSAEPVTTPDPRTPDVVWLLDQHVDHIARTMSDMALLGVGATILGALGRELHRWEGLRDDVMDRGL